MDPDTLFEGLTLSLNADVSMALYKDMIDQVMNVAFEIRSPSMKDLGNVLGGGVSSELAH